MTYSEIRVPGIRLFTASRSITKLVLVNVALCQPVEWLSAWAFRLPRFFSLVPRESDILVGWGMRPSTVRARAFAQQYGLQFIALEDGFLRSFGTGEHFPPLSLVVDALGIYYDSTRPSALENLLSSDGDLLAGIACDAERARELVLQYGLSKYNHAGEGVEAEDKLLSCSRNHIRVAQKVLVIDQTIGDMSVALGGANDAAFDEMLDAALSENPQATVYVKTHPEVNSGRKVGYLNRLIPRSRIVVLREAINPLSLIEKMDRVYVVTSTMGFEALLAGKPVTCFGVPWYAGWGVTDDRIAHTPAWARRSRKRNIQELFAAAYIHYTNYINPVTYQRGNIFDVIDWLVRQKDMATNMHGPKHTGRVLGVGFRRWKAINLKPLLGLNQQLVEFVPDPTSLKALRPQLGDTVVFWGAQPPAEVIFIAQQSRARLLHIEDGFVRSVGLGSDLIRPQSLVLDERGIYFDATRPSDLEVMLAKRTFTADDLARAQGVRAFIVQHGITKYNLEPRVIPTWSKEARSSGRTVVLVPGQVESDASIRLGCTTVRTNLELLQAVRAALPNAFIVYKPHPDVASGNRRGKVGLKAALQLADHIETSLSVVSCIEAVDEVHTMTSLTGFDALLRSKRVVTYGQPFYAGWGLTEDRARNATAFERRTRRLSLDELVAGALLLYPIYWDWDLKGYTTCEAVLHRIVKQRATMEQRGQLNSLTTGWLRRQLRKARTVLSSLLFY